ncbi:50S ribosomal protein L11 methyltransferase [Tenacibaculum sp. C7A-26P2]|uniref:50S ribosomal protein L11 methyltransferase n=1 Tax=Tenacibaculum sp. C7A-26P2 TaxID=3447504 RepID=UPI003F8549FC
MDNVYTEYNFKIVPKDPGTEILIAELGAVGFESFVENENGCIAYIQQNHWQENILNDIYILNSGEFKIEYSFQKIKQTNWNEEWEKNFSPIIVEDKISIRAPFHDSLNCEFDIVIEPKMSFGTGHHETTYMMLQHLLKQDVTNKKVLDMGCGTGILAIFAEMRGAKPIDAIDIDSWCYLNSLENVERNNCKNISVFEGDSNLIKEKKYDLIIANINRNILLNDIGIYLQCLNDEGNILLSGFYKEDVSILDGELTKRNLSLIKQIERNNWVALHYKK